MAPSVGAATLVAILACGCDPVPLAARIAAPAMRAPLNGAVSVDLGAPLDPLSVTGRSVRVEDGEGLPLPVEFDVAGGRLSVRLVVDAATLAAPPASLRLTLLGGLSPHALRAVDGRRLPGSATLSVPLDPVLEDDGSAPRLLTVDGRPVDAGVEHALAPREPGQAVRFVFAGTLDPASVSPESCPFVPTAAGVDLRPVLPRVDWRCIGTRFEVDVIPPASSHALRARLREWGLTGPRGEAPRPAPELRVAAPP